jgi:hypothetical protein
MVWRCAVAVSVSVTAVCCVWRRDFGRTVCDPAVVVTGMWPWVTMTVPVTVFDRGCCLEVAVMWPRLLLRRWVRMWCGCAVAAWTVTVTPPATALLVTATVCKWPWCDHNSTPGLWLWVAMLWCDWTAIMNVTATARKWPWCAHNCTVLATMTMMASVDVPWCNQNCVSVAMTPSGCDWTVVMSVTATVVWWWMWCGLWVWLCSGCCWTVTAIRLWLWLTVWMYYAVAVPGLRLWVTVTVFATMTPTVALKDSRGMIMTIVRRLSLRLWTSDCDCDRPWDYPKLWCISGNSEEHECQSLIHLLSKAFHEPLSTSQEKTSFYWGFHFACVHFYQCGRLQLDQ